MTRTQITGVIQTLVPEVARQLRDLSSSTGRTSVHAARSAASSIELQTCSANLDLASRPPGICALCVATLEEHAKAR